MSAKRALRVDLGHLTDVEAKRILAEHAQIIKREALRWALRLIPRRVTAVGNWLDRDDLLALARIAALEAYVRYDATQPMSLAGWIRTLIRQRLYEAVQSARDKGSFVKVVEVRPDGTLRTYLGTWVRGMVSLDEPFYDAENEWAGTLHDRIEDERSTEAFADLDRTDTERELHSSLVQLSLRQQQVLIAELRGVSGAELGRELGITRQKINTDRQRALSSLRKLLVRKSTAKQLTAP